VEKTELKKYLSDVLSREQTLFTANRLKEDIQNRLKSVSSMHESVKKPDNPITLAVNPDDSNGIKYFSVTIAVLMAIGFVVLWVRSIFVGNTQESFVKPLFIMFGIGMGILLIACILYYLYSKPKVNAANRRFAEQHETEIKDYEKNLLNVKAEQKLLTADLGDKLSNIDKLIIETQSALDALYTLDVIFPKYRYFVAVASFCEYIASGRCDSLEGHEGAYNIYENELRQNVIIGQLNAVIEGLQQIRDAQYMLYEAISESNRIVQGISNEMQGLRNSISAVEKSSAMTAYFAKETANNSRLLVEINRGAYGLLHDKTGKPISYTD